MIMKRNIGLVAIVALFVGCKPGGCPEWVATTETEPWQALDANAIRNAEGADPDYVVATDSMLQPVDGFGGCFSELGWTSLSLLGDSTLRSVMAELFEPGRGACLNICRMPIGANDLARDWYSYNETASDFAMDSFSIANDRETLIPFIHAALASNPELRIWATPWSPPLWMKENGHYACQPLDTTFFHTVGLNGIRPDQVRREGVNMIHADEAYLSAYALYFAKFIEAYRSEGIDIFMVMPQNEFNSCQPFPSCTWLSSTLATFVGRHLGPAMARLGVEVMFGTMERRDEAMVDTVLTDPDCSRYVKGVGFQWAGKYALPGIHRRYPQMKMYQTEQECGDGANDWAGCVYSWTMMKYFFENGVNVYDYWNIALERGGMSRWGWTQNSLVVVDPATRTHEFTHEYYLLKHFSHYVTPGSRLLATHGIDDNIIAFARPDGRNVVIIFNAASTETTHTVQVGDKAIALDLKPQSFNTILL